MYVSNAFAASVWCRKLSASFFDVNDRIAPRRHGPDTWPPLEEVIVDPLMAFLGGGVDSHRDHDIRRVLHELKTMAEETGVALLIIRHLNKTPGGSALYRGGGSIGIIGAARSGLLVAPHPDDEGTRILASTKSNLAQLPPSLTYRIVGDERYDCARVVWGANTDLRADQLLNPPKESKVEVAMEFLEDELADGPMAATDLFAAAKEQDISVITLRRAKKELGIGAFRLGGSDGGWWWGDDPDPENDQPKGDQIHEQKKITFESARQGTSSAPSEPKVVKPVGVGTTPPLDAKPILKKPCEVCGGPTFYAYGGHPLCPRHKPS